MAKFFPGVKMVGDSLMMMMFAIQLCPTLGDPLG